MFKDSISYRLRARKTMLFYTAVFFVVLLLVTVGFLAYKGRKSAKAVNFEATTSKLVVPEGTLLYIGAPGYVSQRIYSNVAEPINPTHSLPGGAAVPANHVYNTSWSYIPCPDASVWGQSFSGCRSMIGDGSGMILKYSSSIEVYGTVIIGDRVAFEAPAINIYSSGRIYANGQDNELGYADKCGAGGVGGVNGGANTTNFYDPVEMKHAGQTDGYWLDCDQNHDGISSTIAAQNDYNLSAINNDLKPYFTVTGREIVGGSGSRSGPAIEWATSWPPLPGEEPKPGDGTTGNVGIGGGGGSGPTGLTAESDHGSSGGGGGGFGVVFKTNNLSVNISAVITAAGGNSQISNEGTVQLFVRGGEHNQEPTAGFGGAGGGGVLIIDSQAINFHSGANNENNENQQFEIFNVKEGIFKPSESWIARSVDDPRDTVYAPLGAAIGKLIVNTGSSISVKKSLQNLGGSDGELRPNYVFRPGDEVVVTLNVSNLSPGQSVQIKDEIYSDGIHISTVVPGTISSNGSVNGAEVVWNFTPTSSQAVLKYNLKVN